jgi:ribosome recycling factor
MKPFRKQNPVNSSDAGRRPVPSLSDQRYQDLLKSASAFFTSAEKSTEQRRQEIIDEIHAAMRRYGLTVDDLLM